ncbi:uncharacterized protein [Choristoneura fumiferana]|uniref:uncharacterized protein n=1 Tax=Choristoneura fumiferana TaxID=7141 RepID=UPI003D15D871
MSPLTRSLLALATAALLHSACAAPKIARDSHCTTVTHGTLMGEKNELPTVYTSPGDQDVSLKVPNSCMTSVIGEEVTVCDDDVSPTVLVPELPLISPVVIHRNGNYYAHSAEVRITLWCRIP